MDKVKLSQVVTGKLPYENITKDNSIVVIGKAGIGPSMIPIEAASLEFVEGMFEDSQLTSAYIEFSKTGVGTVYLIRVNGIPAETTIQGNGVDKLTLVAMDCSDVGNYVSYNIESFQGARYLEITDQDGNKKKYTISGKTIGQVADEINRDAYLANSPIYAISHSDYEMTDCLLDSTEVTLDGGNSETIFSSEYMYDKIEECLNSLLPIKFSQLAVLDGDMLKEVIGRGYIYSLLSDFAKDRVELAQPCIITVGCDAHYPETALLQDLYDFAGNMGNITNIEYSPCEYINIVVAKLSINGMPSSYISDGVMSYCALISNAKLDKSLTNETLPGASGNLLRFDIDDIEKTHDDIVKELAGFGYVTFINDISGNIKVFKSVNMLYGTQGKYHSGYVEYTKPQSLCYLMNVLLLQRITTELHEKLEPLLGEQIDENKVGDVADGVFKSYKSSVKEYTFTVNKIDDYRRIDNGSDAYQLIKGFTRTYNISFDVVPYGEVESLGFALSLW